MTKFSFLLNCSCFKWWKWQTLHKTICWKVCADSHKWKLSTSYYSKEEIWYGKKEQSQLLCWGTQKWGTVFYFLGQYQILLQVVCINKDIKHSLSALVTLGNHLVECKTTINVSQIKLSHIILESEQKLHIRRQMSAYESIWDIKWGLIQSKRPAGSINVTCFLAWVFDFTYTPSRNQI